MNATITQLGKVPVVLRRSADVGAADAAAELVVALRIQISEAAAKAVRPAVLQRITAARSAKERDAAITRVATDWISAHAGAVKNPLHAIFRSAANKEHSLDGEGGRVWTLTAKVKPAAAGPLYDSAGKDGVCAAGADSRADSSACADAGADACAESFSDSCTDT